MPNWKNDAAISVVFMTLSGYVFFKSSDFPVEAAYFPKVFSGALAVLSLILLISTLYKRNITTGRAPVNYKHAVLIVIGLMAYALILKAVGYIVATSLLVFYIIYMLGYRKIITMLLTTVLSVAFAYTVFGVLLRVPLPHLIK